MRVSERSGRTSGTSGGRMENLLIAVIAGLLILVASIASVELGVSVALIEISLGVVAGNVLGLTSPPWMDFLAAFGSILLTFLAGAASPSQPRSWAGGSSAAG